MAVIDTSPAIFSGVGVADAALAEQFVLGTDDPRILGLSATGLATGLIGLGPQNSTAADLAKQLYEAARAFQT
ncbi:MAG: hypothetical protein HY877_01935 [Deltaproteobacteria bacterium]|nr:hypothetical protein [Deltaproteobacteria bacterium]